MRIQISPVLKELLPYLVATAAASVVLTLLLLRLAPGTGRAPAAVTFDVIKYMNAQRQVASAFLNGTPSQNAEAGTLLLQVSRRTREAIAQAAGPDTLVLVKQGVLQGHMRDITDEVLTALGLPTNVPTQDASGALLDEAPTLLWMPMKNQPAPSPAAPAAPPKSPLLP